MINRVLRSSLKAILSTIELVPADKSLHHKIESWVLGDTRGLDTYTARAEKFFEEACELAHAAGLSKEDLLAQVSHEFERGAPRVISDKIGDTTIALSVFSAAHGIDPIDTASKQMDKILSGSI